MTTPTTTPTAELISAFGKRMKEVRERGSVRAALRKGARDLDDLTVNPFIFKGFPEELRGNGYPSSSETAFRDALCLYSESASGGSDPHGGDRYNDLGNTLRSITHSRGRQVSEDSFTIRMHNNLVTARSRESVFRAVREIVLHAGSYKIPVNYITLMFDLRKAYGTPVQAAAVASKWSASFSHTKEE